MVCLQVRFTGKIETMNIRYHSGFDLLQRRGLKPDARLQRTTGEQGQQATDTGRSVLCAHCTFPITTRDQRRTMQGMHEHTFANPHGIIYRIGCFRNAPGCSVLSEEYKEFSWFDGFVWSHAACFACGTHLGWKYDRPGECFFGLVLDRLVEKEEH